MAGQNKRDDTAARSVAFLGLMFALAMALSLLESMIPALPMLPPGVKLGLSNIVTMYCLFFLGARSAFTVAALKSCFVLLLRGPAGASMSLAGGLLSVLVMRLLLLSKQMREQVPLVSIVGAISHNVGQLLAASVLLRSAAALYYLPVMILAGVGMGVLTGLTLRLVMPYFQRLSKAMK